MTQSLDPAMQHMSISAMNQSHDASNNDESAAMMRKSVAIQQSPTKLASTVRDDSQADGVL